MGQYIDYKTYNPIYAPGMGTYSPRGERGDNGESGTCVYYTRDYIKGDQYERDFINSKIGANVLLSSKTDNTENERGYNVGDLVIDTSGDVYTIENDGTETNPVLVISAEPIGNINMSIKKNYTVSLYKNQTCLICNNDEDSSGVYKYIYNITIETTDKQQKTYYGLVPTAVYIDGVKTYMLITQNITGGNGAKVVTVEMCNRATGEIAVFIENYSNNN